MPEQGLVRVTPTYSKNVMCNWSKNLAHHANGAQRGVTQCYATPLILEVGWPGVACQFCQLLQALGAAVELTVDFPGGISSQPFFAAA